LATRKRKRKPSQRDDEGGSERPARSARRSGRRRARRARPLLRALAIATVLLAFGGGIFLARAMLRLDRVVRARFEGPLFEVPSRVYAAPTILSAGLDVTQVDLRGALRRLGYREEPSAEIASPGGVHWEKSRVVAYLRAFEHPSRAEPARRIAIELEGRQVDALRDLDSDRELAAVLLEPELVGSYFGLHREQREPVRLGQVPRHLLDAVLAVEDQRFEAHPGIDVWRIAGAAFANMVAGEVRQGGSTLTQQLVKNFFLTPERTFDRKIQEAAMSLVVEARYEKPAIFEAYLNEIYLGQRGPTSIHGVGEASLFYFGKPVRSLRLEDSALLAGLIRSPGDYSPFLHPEAARARRDLVLRLMHEQGRIDAAAFDTARDAPLSIATRTSEPRETRYFLDALRGQLPEVYDEATLQGQGLRIYSTLDLRLQQIATQALREGLDALEKKHKSLRPGRDGARLQGCLLALRPQTGEVLALVGGREYGESQFDRCLQARRSAGSAFKPFVFVAGLEARRGAPVITLASTLSDTPVSIRSGSKTWAPANYDHKFYGEVSVRTALEKSLNVATVRLGQAVGAERIIDVARRLGIESPLEPVPALALGAADVTPLEMARAYATLASGGVRTETRFFDDLTDASGRTLARGDVSSEVVLDPGVSFLAVSLLEGVVDRGTARAVRSAGIQGPIAGKTGTSNDSKDAWFVGFTPDLVAVAWVGFDEPRDMKLPSSQLAVPIWLRFLKDATGGIVPGAFAPPSDVHRVEIDPVSGAVALAGCPRRTSEYFLEGTEPRTTCPEGGWFGTGGTDQEDADDARGAGERGRGGWLDRLFDRWF
jgi:penicillin-binding protein 1B